MILFVNDKQEIHDVGSTTDKSLSPLYVDEERVSFPFRGWSTAKICCYKVTVSNGIVTMMTPYIDSNLLEPIDMMGHSVEEAEGYSVVEKASAGDEEVIFTGVPDGIISVDARDLEDNVLSFHVTKTEDIVRVFFDDPLAYAADIRLMVN